MKAKFFFITFITLNFTTSILSSQNVKQNTIANSDQSKKSPVTAGITFQAIWEGDAAVKIYFNENQYIFDPKEAKTLTLPIDLYTLKLSTPLGSYTAPDFFSLKEDTKHLNIFLNGQNLEFKKDEVKNTGIALGNESKNNVSENAAATTFADCENNSTSDPVVKKYKDLAIEQHLAWAENCANYAKYKYLLAHGCYKEAGANTVTTEKQLKDGLADALQKVWQTCTNNCNCQ